ncbi:hypothetical protein QCA50_013043 [Cerrena zonata]|uniref:Uncharacterized protein n=1 Tax=Cerrena zonata TaxID=2478898 RepID=A0AAW0G276_9APHY
MAQAPANNSFRVALQPNSLYIATQTILNLAPNRIDFVTFQRKAWHWSFFYTDATGKVTQLHWNVGDIGGVVGEYFGCRPIPEIVTRTKRSVYVSFIRLSGWSSPGLETLVETLRELWKEHEGKPGPTLRAMSPMRSCRTWTLEAVATFVANGWMTAAPDNLETIVTTESKSATNRYISIKAGWVTDSDVNQFRPTIRDV